MSTSLAAEYRKCVLIESCTPDLLPTDTGALQNIWELDETMRAEFSGHIQMWEQGLTHSMELIEALNFIINRAR